MKKQILYLAVIYVLMMLVIMTMPVAAAENDNIHITTSIQEPTSIIFRSQDTNDIVEVILDKEQGYDIKMRLAPGRWMIVESDSRSVPEQPVDIGDEMIEIKIGFNSVRVDTLIEDPSEDPSEANEQEPGEEPNAIANFTKGYAKVSIVITVIVFAVAIFVLIKYRR